MLYKNAYFLVLKVGMTCIYVTEIKEQPRGFVEEFSENI